MTDEAKRSWILDVQEDPDTGDAMIQFPEEFLGMTGWKEGDLLEWVDNKDGSWTMVKKDTK